MAASRSTWRGFLKLSLVSCPVRIMPAVTRSGRVAFHNLNPETGNRVEMRPHDAETGEELDNDDLVMGYEAEKGRFVTVEDEELDALEVESSHVIELDRFVDRGAIDLVYYDTPYFLTPDGKGAVETFRVIRDALERENKIGIGRVVLNRRERAVAVEPRGRGMMMTTLRAASEVRPAAEYFAEVSEARPERAKLELATQILDQKTAPFDPARFEDRYEAALRSLVTAKGKGQRPKAVEAPESATVIDLMAALKRSLQGQDKDGDQAAAARTRKPARRPAAKRRKRG